MYIKLPNGDKYEIDGKIANKYRISQAIFSYVSGHWKREEVIMEFKDRISQVQITPFTGLTVNP